MDAVSCASSVTGKQIANAITQDHRRRNFMRNSPMLDPDQAKYLY
jgi:hypothetical protein